MMKIEKIRHGWFVFLFADCSGSFYASDYLDYDFATELLRKMKILIEQGGVEYVCVQDEPYAFILKLLVKDENIHIIVSTAKKESWRLNVGHLELEPIEKDIFTVTYNTNEFAQSFILQMQTWVEKLGIQEYKDNWFEYPTKLIGEIKKIII